MLSKALTDQVYRRDGWKCRHCNNRNALHPHHVVFKSQGGTDTLDNILTLCNCCHMDGVHGGRLAIHILGVIPGKDILVRFERLKGWKPQ